MTKPSIARRPFHCSAKNEKPNFESLIWVKKSEETVTDYCVFRPVCAFSPFLVLLAKGLLQVISRNQCACRASNQCPSKLASTHILSGGASKRYLFRRVLIDFLWRDHFLCKIFHAFCSLQGNDIYLSVMNNYEFICKALNLARHRWISFKAGFQLCLWNWSRNSSILYKFLLLYAAVLNYFCILFLRHYCSCHVDTLRVMRQWSPSRYFCRAAHEMDGVLKT